MGGLYPLRSIDISEQGDSVVSLLVHLFVSTGFFFPMRRKVLCCPVRFQ